MGFAAVWGYLCSAETLERGNEVALHPAASFPRAYAEVKIRDAFKVGLKGKHVANLTVNTEASRSRSQNTVFSLL